MQKLLAVVLVLGILSGIIGIIYRFNMMDSPSTSQAKIRYVALGDSYTIGEGASESKSWPKLLTNHLQNEGVDIKLIANPSVTGWTTQDLIENELNIFDKSDPTFATLLIGVNDWVQGVEKENFHANLIIILDRMQQKLPDKNKIILVTIPDFSATPQGSRFGNGRNISEGITEFNEIIKSEALKRGLEVVDIFPISKNMKNDPSLIAFDGLHPSALEYALWEELIYPSAIKLLK